MWKIKKKQLILQFEKLLNILSIWISSKKWKKNSKRKISNNSSFVVPIIRLPIRTFPDPFPIIMTIIIIILFFLWYPKESFGLDEITLKFFFNQRIYGANLKKIDYGPQCQIDHFDHYYHRNVKNNLKISVGHFLWLL